VVEWPAREGIEGIRVTQPVAWIWGRAWERGGGWIQNPPCPVGVLPEVKEDGTPGDELCTRHLVAA
jgi:hypothetical protein